MEAEAEEAAVPSWGLHPEEEAVEEVAVQADLQQQRSSSRSRLCLGK